MKYELKVTVEIEADTEERAKEKVLELLQHDRVNGTFSYIEEVKKIENA